MDRNEKKDRVKWIPKSVFFGGILLVIFVVMIIHDKNQLIPIWDNTVTKGTYKEKNDEDGTLTGGEIIVYDDYVFEIRNVDLNQKIKGPGFYYDLNSIFLNKKCKFHLFQGLRTSGEFEFLYTLPGETRDYLEIDYLPREDKLILQTRKEDIFYCFYLED